MAMWFFNMGQGGGKGVWVVMDTMIFVAERA